MKGTTILTVTKDAEWLVAMRPALCEAGRWRLVVAETMTEAGQLLDCTRPDMVVVHWGEESARVDDLEALLWKNSVQKRQVPVVIVAADYQVEEATLLFQLGVSEYVTRADHHEALGRIFSAHSRSAAESNGWSHGVSVERNAGHLDVVPSDFL